MIEESIVIKQNHEKFVRSICETGTVWALENKDGLATSNSDEFEDEEGNPVLLFCFWADKALATSCITGEWHDYKPIEIPLNTFIENWCIGLYNEGYLIGSNFDQNMFGFEVDPLALIVAISNELKQQNREIKLHQYKNMAELVEEIEKYA